ncbi:MAG: hypothetical protein GY820_42880 [Gammaproteobacteria bacterium]|nr:hypothetical protein [Gammaproteobacteria bacterium]
MNEWAVGVPITSTLPNCPQMHEFLHKKYHKRRMNEWAFGMLITSTLPNCPQMHEFLHKKHHKRRMNKWENNRKTTRNNNVFLVARRLANFSKCLSRPKNHGWNGIRMKITGEMRFAARRFPLREARTFWFLFRKEYIQPLNKEGPNEID